MRIKNKKLKERYKKLRSIIEYAFMRAGIFLLRLLPERIVRFLIANLVSIVQFRKKTAEDNLMKVYPRKNEKWRKGILKKMYYYYGLTAVESYITPSQKLFPKMDAGEFSIVEEQLKKGRGVLIASGHLGNFEMAGRLMAQKVPLGVIIKKQHNKYFDDYSNAQRMDDKVTLIHSGKVLRPVLKILRKNGIVVIMTDQNARSQGYQLDFLGHPASTHIAIARIAIAYNIPVVAAGVIRNDKGYPYLTFRNLPAPDNYENSIEGYKEYMQVIQNKFGELVNQYPQHWFWVHRRWRRPHIAM